MRQALRFYKYEIFNSGLKNISGTVGTVFGPTRFEVNQIEYSALQIQSLQTWSSSAHKSREDDMTSLMQNQQNPSLSVRIGV